MSMYDEMFEWLDAVEDDLSAADVPVLAHVVRVALERHYRNGDDDDPHCGECGWAWPCPPVVDMYLACTGEEL